MFKRLCKLSQVYLALPDFIAVYFVVWDVLLKINTSTIKSILILMSMKKCIELWNHYI